MTDPSPSVDAARLEEMDRAYEARYGTYPDDYRWAVYRAGYRDGLAARARLAERQQQEAHENFDAWLLRVGKNQRDVSTWEAWEAAWRHSQALMTPELLRLEAIERAAREHQHVGCLTLEPDRTYTSSEVQAALEADIASCSICAALEETKLKMP